LSAINFSRIQYKLNSDERRDQERKKEIIEDEIGVEKEDESRIKTESINNMNNRKQTSTSVILMLLLGLLYAVIVVQSFTSSSLPTSKKKKTIVAATPIIRPSSSSSVGSNTLLSTASSWYHRSLSLSSSSALRVSSLERTESVEDVDSSTDEDEDDNDSGLPELGADGLWHITNEDEYKALLAANPDKLIILKVFAPWCKACKGLAPKFQAIKRDKKIRKFTIGVGIIEYSRKQGICQINWCIGIADRTIVCRKWYQG